MTPPAPAPPPPATRAGRALLSRLLSSALLVGAALLSRPRAAVAEPVFPVVDLHVDVPWQIHYHRHPDDMSKGVVTRRALAAGRVAGLVLPLYVPDGVREGGPEPSDLEDLARTVERVVWAPGSPFGLLAAGSDANRPPAIRAWLSTEGAQALASDTHAIEAWVARGVRLVSLVHLHDNALAGSSTGKLRGGLSERGKDLARRAVTGGALLDVSHASDAAFDDLAALAAEARAPLVASHSNARSVCDHPRNLTDAQLRVIAASGGVVGVNLHGPYLSRDPAPAMREVIAQMDHLVRTAGEDHVSIGSDFDGGIAPPAGLESPARFPALAAALLRHGYSERLVRSVFADNALRVLGWTREQGAR